MQNSESTIDTSRPLLLGIARVAQSMDVSVRTVWAWILQNEIPTVRLGRRRLIRLSDLELFIEKHISDQQ
jgi:excisionase family DNA binding protein